MKISLLLIVAMCLVAFAYAAKPKFDFNKENGCTAERHGWSHDAHEEVCEKTCTRFNKKCICFWDEKKEVGTCYKSKKFRKLNAALENAKKEAEYADSDEGKAEAKAKKEADEKWYEQDIKGDKRRKKELYDAMHN